MRLLSILVLTASACFAAETNVLPCQVRIGVEFVAYKLKDIDALSRREGVGRITEQDLGALRSQGKARVLCSMQQVTLSGSEATVKAVREFIYPTEFTLVASEKTTKVDGPLSGRVAPGCYETREVGGILTTLPAVFPDGRLIHLSFAPEWEDFGGVVRIVNGKTVHVPHKEPFFNTWSLTTTVNVMPGVPILIGRAPHPKDAKKEVFVFCRATLLDYAGNVIE